MKNFWDQRQTTNFGFYLCFDKGLGLLTYRRFSINWIILNVFMVKLGCKPFVRTSLKVKYGAFLVMMQIRDSSLLFLRNMQWLSKKGITQPLKGRWNLHNCSTSKKLEWRLLTNLYCAQPLSLIRNR